MHRVAIPTLSLWARPERVFGTQVSQLVYGQSVEILRKDAGWALIRGLSDYYPGWVMQEFLAEDDGQARTHRVHEAFASEELHGNMTIFPRYSEFTEAPYPGSRKLERAEFACSHLGTPYVRGGTTPFGFDCSGFIQHCLRNEDIFLPRDVWMQYTDNRLDGGESFEDALPGDLLFFGPPQRPNHVAILLTESTFVHASNPYGGVVMSKWLPDLRYRPEFIGWRRIPVNCPREIPPTQREGFSNQV
jgi:hypothetical protein